MKNKNKNMNDPIVQKVVDQFEQRSKIGLKKYKKNLQENNDGTLRFLQHFREELMDATLYTMKLESILEYTVELEMTKLYYALQSALSHTQDGKIAICDIDEAFYQQGIEIDKLPF